MQEKEESPDRWHLDTQVTRYLMRHQARWAERNGLALAPGGHSFVNASEALFVETLSPETIMDLEDGAGSELNRIQSLRSSSCLVLNVFEPWRSRPVALGNVFGTPVQDLRFETKQPTGLKGVPPHLDLLMSGPTGVIAIESKFVEMYSPTEQTFADSYFVTDGLWAGLTSSRDLAEQIAQGREQYRWLHAAQLLKHALGLKRNQSADFRLVLLWYRIDNQISEEIESEIGRFTRAVSDDFDFTSMTYQELVTRLQPLGEPIPGYFEYLSGRYRLDGEWQRRLPLLEMGSRPGVNHRSSLDQTIDGIDPTALSNAYLRSVSAAPQRPLRQKQFLVGHDGAGDASESSAEKVVAKALFNHGRPFSVGNDQLTLIDYEVPLRAERADGGIGEVDLLGIDQNNRPWIIELKVSPNTETPLKALMQALRYSAITDTNRHAIARELREHPGVAEVAWPAVLAVAADRGYWDRLMGTAQAGAWLQAIHRLGGRLEATLGLQVVLLDLGQLDVEIIDGRARLASAPTIERLVEP